MLCLYLLTDSASTDETPSFQSLLSVYQGYIDNFKTKSRAERNKVSSDAAKATVDLAKETTREEVLLMTREGSLKDWRLYILQKMLEVYERENVSRRFTIYRVQKKDKPSSSCQFYKLNLPRFIKSK